MDFDFNLILVPVTVAFFAIWAVDKLVLKQRKTKGKQGENFIITWAYDFWPVLAVVLVLRSFLFEPFTIPSDSMVPTLETGDYILVNKFSYGVRLPIVNNKVISVGEPQRGDVAVFRYPVDPKINFIKRIIGLPGDHIVYDRGELTVNGQKISNVKHDFSRDKDLYERSTAQYFQDTLDGHTFTIRTLDGLNPLIYAYSTANDKSQLPFVSTENQRFVESQGQSWEVTVKQGHYFAMGDNRDQSSDSRFWGLVPEQNLVGKAIYIWTHKEPGFNLPSFSRNGAID